MARPKPKRAKVPRKRRASPPAKQRAKPRPKVRADSPGERAKAIVREVAKRLGIRGKVSVKVKVRGKSAIATVKPRRGVKLRELVGKKPGPGVRRGLKGRKHLANVRVKTGREYVSVASLTRDQDRLVYGIPKRVREILAGVDSPKARRKILRWARKKYGAASLLEAPIVRGVEVYVTKDDPRLAKRRRQKQARQESLASETRRQIAASKRAMRAQKMTKAELHKPRRK